MTWWIMPAASPVVRLTILVRSPCCSRQPPMLTGMMSPSGIGRIQDWPKARERIDGAVACAIALALAKDGSGGPTIYETARPEGFLFV